MVSVTDGASCGKPLLSTVAIAFTPAIGSGLKVLLITRGGCGSTSGPQSPGFQGLPRHKIKFQTNGQENGERASASTNIAAAQLDYTSQTKQLPAAKWAPKQCALAPGSRFPTKLSLITLNVITAPAPASAANNQVHREMPVSITIAVLVPVIDTGNLFSFIFSSPLKM